MSESAMPCALHDTKSSTPYAGDECTTPVPAFGGHVVAEINGRRALVARMRDASGWSKAQVDELVALRRRDHRAVEAVRASGMLRRAPRRGSAGRAAYRRARRSISGCRFERLVRGNGPRRRGPDHDAAVRRAAARAGRTPARSSPARRSRTATSMVGSVLSVYSTSASASAEPQSKHQLTGFRPRNT